jgi:hypothetical protein
MIIRNNLRYFNEKYGREYQMDHRELYEALGLDPKKHLPKEGLGPRYIGNVLVWVDPKIPGRNQDAKRVWCRCPNCGKVLTAGKLQQHRRIHRIPKEAEDNAPPDVARNM